MNQTHKFLKDYRTQKFQGIVEYHIVQTTPHNAV